MLRMRGLRQEHRRQAHGRSPGRPCCPDCFDTCLKREGTPKKARESALPTSPREKATNIGGLNTDSGPGRMSFSKSRESSPALQELEQRLGIATRRDSNATLEDLTQRLNMIGRESPTRSSRYSAAGSAAGSPRTAQSRLGSPSVESRVGLPGQADSPRRRYDRLKSIDYDVLDRASSQSPIRRQRTGSGVTEEALEEMKRRFIKGTTPPALVASLTGSPSTPPRSPIVSPTPDLVSDVSDSATSVSGIDTPPRSDYRSLTFDRDDVSMSKLYGTGFVSRYNRDQYIDPLDDVIVEETRSQLNTPNRTQQRNAAASPRNSITSPRSSITSPRNSFTSPRSSVASPPLSSIASPPLHGASTPPLRIRKSSENKLRTSLSQSSLRSSYCRTPRMSSSPRRRRRLLRSYTLLRTKTRFPLHSPPGRPLRRSRRHHGCLHHLQRTRHLAPARPAIAATGHCLAFGRAANSSPCPRTIQSARRILTIRSAFYAVSATSLSPTVEAGKRRL
ncbi:hypothetical protein BD626DRAFT_191259 [Schizophyllum amplum]|uniref:Uncharacterized protein n=1 Tax=Schizophyllum amplum TaxID=97359 RepID=A0A550CLT6_9AGAR|nr:hypothetical protein BD626DRAFT_191259 [Auriculariopsis ampla]